MAVKTAKRKTTNNAKTTNATNITNARTKSKTSGGKTSAQMASRGGRPAGVTGQMNKGKGAVGASKPPKPVSRPAGGTKGGGKKGC